MSAIIEKLIQAKSSGNYQGLVAAIPYAEFLGITVEHRDTGLVTKMSFTEKLIGNPAIPALHGGTIGALLESAAIFQLFYQAETVTVPKTITITIDYLRSGRPADIFARAVVTKHGKRVANVRAEAWQDDPSLPIATANVHLLVTPQG